MKNLQPLAPLAVSQHLHSLVRSTQPHSTTQTPLRNKMEAQSVSVGFLGLGIMGEAMARNLLKADAKFASVTVWNRSPEKVRVRGRVRARVAAGRPRAPRTRPSPTRGLRTDQPPPQCDALVAEGAKRGASPAEVVRACDITFGMLSDPAAALAVVEGDTGVARGVSGRAYVDMSTVDDVTSKRIAEIVTAAGGRYLEASS